MQLLSAEHGKPYHVRGDHGVENLLATNYVKATRGLGSDVQRGLNRFFRCLANDRNRTRIPQWVIMHCTVICSSVPSTAQELDDELLRVTRGYWFLLKY